MKQSKSVRDFDFYMHKDKEQHPLPDKCQLQHAMDLLDNGKSHKQVEAMTGISKSALIRARRT